MPNAAKCCKVFNPLTPDIQYIVDYTVLACSHNSASHRYYIYYIVKNSLSVFERGENLLQNGILVSNHVVKLEFRQVKKRLFRKGSGT